MGSGADRAFQGVLDASPPTAKMVANTVETGYDETKRLGKKYLEFPLKPVKVGAEFIADTTEKVAKTGSQVVTEGAKNVYKGVKSIGEAVAQGAVNEIGEISKVFRDANRSIRELLADEPEKPKTKTNPAAEAKLAR